MKKLALALGVAGMMAISSFAVEAVPGEGMDGVDINGKMRGVAVFNKAKIAMYLSCDPEGRSVMVVRSRARQFILRNVTDSYCTIELDGDRPVYVISGCGEGMYFGRRFVENGYACWVFKDGGSPGRKNDYAEIMVWDSMGNLEIEDAGTLRRGGLRFVEEQMYY